VDPGVAVVAAAISVIVIAASALGAVRETTAPWRGPACAGLPRVGPAVIGTWFRQDPVIDDAGVLTGQRLIVGRGDGAPGSTLDLDPESFAAGPFGAAVLVGSDDGARSTLSLLDVHAGCDWTLGTATDVVRRATLSPAGDAVFEVRVVRSTRADLGVWRRPLDGGPARRIVDPIAADARFGRTWSTELVWSLDGRSLAVQSCGEIACRTRVLDEVTGGLRTIADPALGELVGVVGDRLVVRGACRGLPCPLLSVGLDGGAPVTLEAAAGLAVLAADAAGGPARVVYETDASGRALRTVTLDGRGRTEPVPLPVDRRLVAGPARSGGAVTIAPGWTVLSADGRIPTDGPRRTTVRRATDGQTAAFEEVSR
jgi:hypothetical protein